MHYVLVSSLGFVFREAKITYSGKSSIILDPQNDGSRLINEPIRFELGNL